MEPRRGRSVVLLMYAAVVGTAAVLGYVLGAVILPERLDGPLPVAELGPIAFPITPSTLAIYGAVVVGLGLGAALGLVSLAARRETARGD